MNMLLVRKRWQNPTALFLLIFDIHCITFFVSVPLLPNLTLALKVQTKHTKMIVFESVCDRFMIILGGIMGGAVGLCWGSAIEICWGRAVRICWGRAVGICWGRAVGCCWGCSLARMYVTTHPRDHASPCTPYTNSWHAFCHCMNMHASC